MFRLVGYTYRLGQKFLDNFLSHLFYHLMLYRNLSKFYWMFNNNPCVHVLNITDICISAHFSDVAYALFGREKNRIFRQATETNANQFWFYNNI